MAIFRFRLQSYLNLKEKLEDEKKLAYGQALRKLEEERRIKRMLLQQKETTLISFKEGIQSKINPVRFQEYNNYIELMKVRIIQQDKVIALAEENAEAKRLELVEAVKQRKMLEKLREKAMLEFVNMEKIAEQKIVDEIVSYQYNNRNG